MIKGIAPSDLNEQEAVIKSFNFTPYASENIIIVPKDKEEKIKPDHKKKKKHQRKKSKHKKYYTKHYKFFSKP